MPSKPERVWAEVVESGRCAFGPAQRAARSRVAFKRLANFVFLFLEFISLIFVMHRTETVGRAQAWTENTGFFKICVKNSCAYKELQKPRPMAPFLIMSFLQPSLNLPIFFSWELGHILRPFA